MCKMIKVILHYFTQQISISVCVVCSSDSTDGGDRVWKEPIALQGEENTNAYKSKCWMSLKAQELFQAMEEVDRKYATARESAQRYFDETNFDNDMLETMLIKRAVANREIHKQRPNHAKIPSGMNLGGQCMMRMPLSVLFFHRMKLRKDTFFRINYLHNDIENMTLRANLSLNTLHLTGAYDRSMIDKDPSALIYTPSFGELQILMEGVEYTIQGRYRLITERLVIELIVSTLEAKNILLTYARANETDPPIKLEKEHLGDFMMRLKTDLDKWIQDYFNDYLIMISLGNVPSISELQEYDNQKATQLAVFTDNALTMMNKKLNNIGGDSISLPNFKILASYGLTIEIYDGKLRGLNTMYRRSVATTLLERENLRYVDTIIGFSDLKVSYQYEVYFPPGPRAAPSLTGVLIMSANELTAHLSLGLLIKPEIVELDIDFINRLGLEAITVEGAANLHIANFKHILRHEIATIMSNSVTYGVRLLKTLPRCKPFVFGMFKEKPKSEIVNIQTTPLYSSSESRVDSNSVESSQKRSSTEVDKQNIDK